MTQCKLVAYHNQFVNQSIHHKDDYDYNDEGAMRIRISYRIGAIPFRSIQRSLRSCGNTDPAVARPTTLSDSYDPIYAMRCNAMRYDHHNTVAIEPRDGTVCQSPPCVFFSVRTTRRPAYVPIGAVNQHRFVLLIYNLDYSLSADENQAHVLEPSRGIDLGLEGRQVARRIGARSRHAQQAVAYRVDIGNVVELELNVLVVALELVAATAQRIGDGVRLGARVENEHRLLIRSLERADHQLVLRAAIALEADARLRAATNVRRVAGMLPHDRLQSSAASELRNASNLLLGHAPRHDNVRWIRAAQRKVCVQIDDVELFAIIQPQSCIFYQATNKPSQ